MNRKYVAPLIIVMILLVLPMYAQADPVLSPLRLPSARMAGLGAYHVTIADDFGSLFTNPAGFAGIEGEFGAAELSFSLYGPVFDMFNIAADYLQGASSLDFSGLVGPTGFLTGLTLGGPISVGWVGKGFGLGLFSNTTLYAEASGADLEVSILQDIILSAGYALRLGPEYHHVDIGFLVKGFVRGNMDVTTSILSVDQLQSIDYLNDQEFIFSKGMGIDAGVIYEIAKTFSIAVACQDIFSPVVSDSFTSVNNFLANPFPTSADGRAGLIRPNLSAGVAWRPRFNFLQRYISDIVLSAQYEDFLDLFLSPIPRNPVLNAALGLELILLDVLSIRAGIGDMLPQLGFGIDLSFMRIDLAMRGIELGLDPGILPVFCFDFAVLFRY